MDIVFVITEDGFALTFALLNQLIIFCCIFSRTVLMGLSSLVLSLTLVSLVYTGNECNTIGDRLIKCYRLMSALNGFVHWRCVN